MTDTVAAALPACLCIRVPDPLACQHPRGRTLGGRFHQHPYFALVTTAREATASRPGWRLIGVESVEHRSKVTFHLTQTSFQYLSVKTGSLQSGLGPWELLNAKEMEVDPHRVAYQTHGIRLRYDTPDGEATYGPDSIEVDAEGVLAATEVKASQSYFAEPEYASLMRLAERDLPTVGIRFIKRTGDEMTAVERRRRVYNINRAFDDRFSRFDARQLAAAADLFAAEGPEVPLGRMGEAMGLHPSSALQVINALMCTRHLAYDLDEFVCPDTALRAVPPAKTPRHDFRAFGR